MANWWDAAPKASPLDVALAAENVDPKIAEIARSVYKQESDSGQNTRTSNAGAVGGMQIRPATFAGVADKDWNINDPVQNARGGVRYLAQMYQQAGGDPVLTAAGYYGGPGGLEKARRGVAVSDPRNPNAPTTLEYGKQVAGRLLNAVVPSANAATPSAPQKDEWWAAAPVVEASAPQAAPPKSGSDKVAPGGVSSLITGKAQEAGALTNLARGVGQGIKADIIGGPAQLLRNIVPEGVGRAVDQFGNYLADLGVPIARVNGAEDMNRQVREQEAQYQKDTEGSVAAGVGRVGANIAGALAGGGGGIVGGGGRGGQAAARLLGGGQGAQAAGRLIGTSAGSAALGAGSGALAPVTQEGDYGQNKLAQIATGAAVGGVLPGAAAAAGAGGRYIGNAARSLTEPFTEAGRTRIAGNLLQRFAQGGPVGGNAAELVAGSTPDLAQATGNAGIGVLTRGLQSASPQAANAMAERGLANNAARVSAIEDIAGNPGARQAVISARDDAVAPLYEAATAKNAPLDAGLRALLNRPSMQRALDRAEALAQEQGGTFSLAQTSPLRRTVTNTTSIPGTEASIAGAGAATPATAGRTFTTTRTINPRAGVAGEGTAGRTQEVSGQDLQTLKMAMDSLLADPASGIAGKEVSAVRDTRNALVNWMEKQIPEFTAARTQYAEMSKPLAQMDIAQRLLDRYASATRDLSGNPKLRAEAFNRALQDEGKLLKNSDVFAGYKSLEDVFTPEQLASLRNVAEDLSRSAIGQHAEHAAGSNTFQNLSTNNILENALPGPVRALVGGTSGPVGTVAGKVGNLIYGGSNEAIQNRLLEMLMQPQSGLAALQNVRGNQLAGPLGGNALLQRLAPNLLPAGTIGANMLARPSGQ